MLTGLPIGEADASGAISEGTINYLVAARLVELYSFKQTVVEETRKRKKRVSHRKTPATATGTGK